MKGSDHIRRIARRCTAGVVALASTAVLVIGGTAARVEAVTCPDAGSLSFYNNNFTQGTRIPYMGTDYVSQGLAYWGSRDWLISSHSDDTLVLPQPNIIAIKTRSGTMVKTLKVKDSSGAALQGHMGGLALSANHLWVSTVSGSKNLFRIPLTSIASAADGGSVRADGAWSVKAFSYSTFYNGSLFVGEFSDNLTGTSSLHKYTLSNNAPVFDRTISTPTRVQGVVIADGYYIFSTSYGQQCRSRLKFRNISTGTMSPTEIVMPPMSEGIVNVPRGASGWADDWIYVNFESGSDQYNDCPLRTLNFMHAVTTVLTP